MPPSSDEVENVMQALAGQKPSVGRIVHYMARGSADGVFKPECRAAIITEVSGDNSEWISLCILNPTGLFFTHRVPFEDNKNPGTWHWPERV
jgi:hypothetical protein